ncbi:unnamed protein product, partial [Timema podura]|nr:unnamed protein product [Timema podura]
TGEESSGNIGLKSKRSPAGLIPFPRVGRSGPGLSWSLESPELQEVKRQGLIPFPRVGRGGGYILFSPSVRGGTGMDKRDSGGDKGGMWFGPRLGRRDKRSVDLADAPWALVALRDIPNFRRHEGYTPHLDRDPNEDDEESLIDEDVEDETGSRRSESGRRSRSTPSRHQAPSSS